MSAGIVYLIKSGDYYKIGRTVNLERRFAALRTGLPLPASAVHVWQTAHSQSLERLLHQRVAHARTRGEWYQLTEADIEHLTTLDNHDDRQDRDPDHPLKRWRQCEGITQAELARRCGVRVNTVARWERGEQVPRGALLVKLLDVTGLPADAIVTPERFLDQHPHVPGRPPKSPTDSGDIR